MCEIPLPDRVVVRLERRYGDHQFTVELSLCPREASQSGNDLLARAVTVGMEALAEKMTQVFPSKPGRKKTP